MRWKSAIVQGIIILLWLAFGLFCMCDGYDFWGAIWGTTLIMVIGNIIDFINLSIEIKEIENKKAEAGMN